jgi:uncharacterized protein (DUF2267 family)
MQITALARSMHTTTVWIDDIAREFGTDDRNFVYRVTRAWLHTVRDRLAVQEAADFAAQLPEHLRGVFYEGWRPSHVPVKYGWPGFAKRFCAEADIGMPEAAATCRSIARALNRRMGGDVSRIAKTMPSDLRKMLSTPRTPLSEIVTTA